MKILLGGDIVPKSEEVKKLFVDGETKALFGDVCDLIKGANYTVINLECALTDSNNEIRKFGPCLKAPTACADTLKNLGVTHVARFGNGRNNRRANAFICALSRLRGAHGRMARAVSYVE